MKILIHISATILLTVLVSVTSVITLLNERMNDLVSYLFVLTLLQLNYFV